MGEREAVDEQAASDDDSDSGGSSAVSEGTALTRPPLPQPFPPVARRHGRKPADHPAPFVMGMDGGTGGDDESLVGPTVRITTHASSEQATAPSDNPECPHTIIEPIIEPIEEEGREMGYDGQVTGTDGGETRTNSGEMVTDGGAMGADGGAMGADGGSQGRSAPAVAPTDEPTTISLAPSLAQARVSDACVGVFPTVEEKEEGVEVVVEKVRRFDRPPKQTYITMD